MKRVGRNGGGDGPDTRDLVVLAAEGNQEAWSRLYDRHRTLMRLFVRGRIPAEFRGRFDTEEVLSSGLSPALGRTLNTTSFRIRTVPAWAPRGFRT